MQVYFSTCQIYDFELLHAAKKKGANVLPSLTKE